MTANRDEEGFGQLILARQKALATEVSERSLNIAVLGPNLEKIRNIGTLKRYQIRDALQDDGHSPFFPEHRLDYSLSVPWVEQERRLLSDGSIDLVIMLNTNESGGVLVELGNFVSVPEIRVKTGVLFPSELYYPKQSLPANTAHAYLARLQYTEEDLESCQLVAECRWWAYARRSGIWPRVLPRGF